MVLSSPYHPIKGYPVNFNTETHQVNTDEFKHVLIYYYVSAHNDESYKDVRLTISGIIIFCLMGLENYLAEWLYIL